MIKDQKRAFRNLMLVTQLGISMMAPIFVCIFIGYFLDSRYGTKTMLLLMLLGFLAGCRNGWWMIKRMIRLDQNEEEDARGQSGGDENRVAEGHKADDENRVVEGDKADDENRVVEGHKADDENRVTK